MQILRTPRGNRAKKEHSFECPFFHIRLEKQQRPEARVLCKEHKTVKGGVPGHFPQETAASRILMYPVDQGRAALETEERQLRAECECKEKRDQKREEERGEQKSFARLCGYLYGVILPV